MILLDTHVLIWSRIDQDRISTKAAQLIENASELCFAAISLWEIAMLVQKQRVELTLEIEDWIDNLLDLERYRLLPISPAIAIQSGRLDMHGDPADRLIVASSLTLDIPLITADRMIHRLDFVNAVW